LWGFGVEMMHFGAFIPEIRDIVPDFSVPLSRKSFWGFNPQNPPMYSEF